MRSDSENADSGERALSGLGKIPLLSFYARTRGEPFVLSWFHRVAGIAIVIFLWGHLLTSFTTPAFFGSRVGLLVLSIILIYHSLNGGRLILYEVFGVRNDESLIRWAWGLSLLFVLFIGLLMVIGNQEVSPIFFWSVIFVSSLILCFAAASRILQTEHAATWKLQRITGAFLLILVPAHIVFMHLNASVAHPAPAAILRMQEIFLRVVDAALLLGVLYHGGYGLISVLGDYVASRPLRVGAGLLIAIGMAVCAVYRLS
jgi:succinate dehydrogenase hydrophobic anchor subunit